MKTISLFVITILFTVLMTACSKEEGYSDVQVRMTDEPGDFQKVNVEILAVEVHYSDTEEGRDGWVTLATKSGIYDLLLLQNDVTVVLANGGKLPIGLVDQMRLVLGSENSIVIDDVVFDLKTPSAQQSGLKINLGTVFGPNKTYQILIDFDAGKSIVDHGNGSFSLKPVIKVESIVEIDS